jgi:hypothetical protein
MENGEIIAVGFERFKIRNAIKKALSSIFCGLLRVFRVFRGSLLSCSWKETKYLSEKNFLRFGKARTGWERLGIVAGVGANGASSPRRQDYLQEIT